MDEISTLGYSKQRILEELLAGPKGIHELSRKLNIRNNAVREHLSALESRGYVESRFVKTGVGRPRKIYHVSAEGMNLFPKKYDFLLKILLDELTKENGIEWVREFLKRAGQRIANENPGNANGVSALLNFYNSLGCMATAFERDGALVIKRNNCIYYSLALDKEKLLCSTFEDALIKSMLPSYKLVKKDTVTANKFDCEMVLSKTP
ncbi:MAG: helix-turn-helix transcriptional regulator [Thermoplasmata archaeon]